MGIKLIIISGKAESGKTTTAIILRDIIEKYGDNKVLIVSFASYLKFICKEYFGWNGLKDDDGRTLLQYIGTDIVRKNNPDFWVRTVYDFIKTFNSEFDFFIIDDARFPNEIEFFTDRGVYPLSIRVERLDFNNSLTEDQKRHPSEIALDNFGHHIYLESNSGFRNLENAIKAQVINSSDWYYHKYE